MNIISYVASLYWSPSQASAEFGSFITNLEKKVVHISRSNLQAKYIIFHLMILELQKVLN